MKYCNHCGAQLVDDAVVCTNCGCAAENTSEKSKNETLRTAAKIFMLLGCITGAFAFLIPLCWMVPMTVHYWKSVKNNTPVSTAFKVCSLLFVDLIAGILMLCDRSEKEA